MDETAGARSSSWPAGGATQDRLLDGRVVIRQPAKGHRAGTDAVLLAAASGRVQGGRVIDVGSGVGAAGIAVALREREAQLVMIDKDPCVSLFARQNVALNGLSARARVVEADVTDRSACRAAGLLERDACLVLTNPPFFEPNRVRVSPDRDRAAAHVGTGGSSLGHSAIEEWVRACAALLAPNGRLVMLHRPDALPEIFRVFTGRFGNLRLMPIYPRENAAAIRVIVAGVKGSRAPATIQPGLILHSADGRFTERAEAVHHGDAMLEV